MRSSIRVFLTLGLCLCGLLLIQTHLSAQNRAMGFSWGGRVESNINATTFSQTDHSVSFWFMQQYPGAYSGPMLSTTTTTNRAGFSMGQANFSAGKQICRPAEGTKDARKGSTALYMQINGNYWRYETPSLVDNGRWHHFAYIKSGSSFRVYLDGNPLSPDTVKAENVPANFRPSGNLCLGADAHTRRQFYGLLDELKLYSIALSPTQVSSLSTRQNLAIAPASIVAMQNFDNALPAGWTASTAATFVTNTWNNAIDAAQMPAPNHVTDFHVPFPKGEAWLVIQRQASHNGGENGVCGSHVGNSAFSLDLIRADNLHQDRSNGEVILSGCRGLVDSVVAGYDTTTVDDPSNFLRVRGGAEEWISYQHFAKNSNVLQQGDSVQHGDFIALVGDVGAQGAMHLHSSLSTNRDGDVGVTRPFAYSNYEYSTDQGKTWIYASRRVPQLREWIRSAVDTYEIVGRIQSLRVNEKNIPYGNGDDRLNAEVILTLQGATNGRVYGFGLAANADSESHKAMLDQLRTAFRLNRAIRIRYKKTNEQSFTGTAVAVELD